MKVELEKIRLGVSSISGDVIAGLPMNELGDVVEGVDLTSDFNNCVVSLFNNTRRTIDTGHERYIVSVTRVGIGLEKNEVADFPFCGGEYGKAVYCGSFTSELATTWWKVTCSACRLEMKHFTKREVIRQWNDRAPIVHARNVLEQVKKENPYPKKDYPEPSGEEMVLFNELITCSSVDGKVLGHLRGNRWDQCVAFFEKYLGNDIV